MTHKITLELKEYGEEKAWKVTIQSEGTEELGTVVFGQKFKDDAAPWATVVQVMAGVSIIIGRTESK